MINLYFGSKNHYITSLHFTGEANIPKSSKVFHGTSTGPSCGASSGPNHGTL